jgi:hypothetical protein
VTREYGPSSSYSIRSTLILLTICWSGCALFKDASGPAKELPPAQQSPAPSPTTRDEGYSLLYKLLADEKDVSKLLLIKKESAQIRDLIKEISRITGEAQKRLEKFASGNSQINLKLHSLPVAEEMTRDSIEKARAKALLRSRGAEFELQLLLSQLEALNYGEHLARFIINQESSSERAAFLKDLELKLRDLYSRGLAMLSLRQP